MERTPTHEQHAREIFNLPPEWKITMWKVVGDKPPLKGITITGAVMVETFKKGPRKGRPSWAKRDRDTEMSITLLDDMHTAWLERWERETGKCCRCDGTGREWAVWHHETGTRTRACSRCHEMLFDFTQLSAVERLP